MSAGLPFGTRVRVVDSHESWAGVTGRVVGWDGPIVLVQPDRAPQDGLPALRVQWWLLEVVR